MSIEIKENVPLAPYTTLKVGGAAEYFTTVSTEDALVEAVAFAEAQGLPTHILGGGSNTLVADEGVKGLVMHMAIRGMRSEVSDGGTVLLTVGAGEEFDAVVAYSVEEGWWGLENLSHIPGTVGATPVQNVGAYGVEIQDVVSNVRVYDPISNSFKVLTNHECMFGYRDSIFKRERGKRLVITGVVFKLQTVARRHIEYKDLASRFEGVLPSQKEIREAVMKIRSAKFPDWKKTGTAGSFFKNPFVTEEQFEALKAKYPEMPGFKTESGSVKIPLGWVLDKLLDLRGYTQGNISTFENQALVLVAYEGATAREIKDFADRIVSRIKKEIDLDVEWEVTQMK
jgi:UDP-N-acetylmuramate dehydrogenase